MSMPEEQQSYVREVETEIMCFAVGEVVSAILTAKRLSEDELLEILGNLGVNSVEEIEDAVELLEHMDAVSRIGAAKLGAVIKESIVTVAEAVVIDPDALARILTRGFGGSVDDIVNWLRAGNGLAGHA